MASFQASSLLDGSVVYGRESEKEKLVDLLLSDDYNSRNVNVICMVGANGVGKTTMLHLVSNDKRVYDTFERRLYISISKNCDEKRLMNDIIESLTCSPCDITEQETLEEILKDEMMNKKLLLLLDDAENGETTFWSNLWILISVAAKGSAVLVTTRRNKVANVMGAMLYPLHCLSDQYCGKIFHEKIFSCYDLCASYPDLELIGKNLLGRCANNILRIEMISGLLSRSLTENWWTSVSQSEFWHVQRLGGGQVLRVCYEFLPAHLKRCFAYCSLFPRDYIFTKHQLVRLWLSQGLIDPMVGTDLEEIGIQYFDELCHRSFLRHSSLHDAKEEKFVMHGLVHDLAHYCSMPDCFRFENPLEELPERVSHFSLVPFEYQTVSLNLKTKNARDLLSFLVINRSAFQQNNIISPILNLVGLHDIFVKCKSLRALDVSNTGIRELPKSIGLLRSLKYLGLNKTKIKSVPSEIHNLICLQTLEANDCNNLVELPECMPELTNLLHLDVTKKAGFVGMPVGIGKLTKLQSLATFNVGSDEMQCGIEELENLNNLKGSLSISQIENVKSSLHSQQANLNRKCYLETLSLQWSCDSTRYVEDEEDAEIATQVLESLQPSDNLQELIIRNFAGNRFPLWIEDRSFSKLVSIVLDNFLNCSMFPALGSLPSLRNLSIQKFYGVEKIEFVDSSSIAENENNFPSLEQLKIWEMYELKELVEVKYGDFPRLHSLFINKCPLLKNIPCFHSLVELSISNCIKLPEIPDLPSLESLKLEGLNKITSLNLPLDLPLLTMVEICYCSELSHIEKSSWLSSVEKIRLIQCPKLDWHLSNFKKENYSSFTVLTNTNEDSDMNIDNEINDATMIQDDLYDSLKKTLSGVPVLKEEACKESAQPQPNFMKEGYIRICGGCKSTIGPGRFLSCMDTCWHPDCFCCHACNKPISDLEFIMHEDKPYHKWCYRELYHPKCDVCYNFIPTNKNGLIEYRAHPFWMQKYCPSHEQDNTFRCCTCERMEPSDVKYISLDDDRKLCLDCLHSAIMDSGDCLPLLDNVLEFYEGLNMKVDQLIPVQLVDKQSLNKAMGTEKEQNHVSGDRAVCLSEEQIVTTILKRPVISSENKIEHVVTEPYKLIRRCKVTAILILFGFPRLLTGSILAHEMMHAWLRLNGYKSLSPVVEEGICQVMSHMWLEAETMSFGTTTNVPSMSAASSSRNGPKSNFEKKLGEFFKYQIEYDLSSTHGDGFRLGHQAVCKYGLKSTTDHIKLTGSFPS